MLASIRNSRSTHSLGKGRSGLKRYPFSLSGTGKLGTVAGTGVAIVLLLGFYSYYALTAKQDRLVQRNLRALAATSRQIAGSINGLEGLLVNTAQPGGKGRAGTVEPRQIEAAGALVRSLEIHAVELSEEAAPLPHDDRTRPTVVFDADHLSLTLRYLVPGRTPPLEVTGRADLAALVPPLLDGESFDALMLVDGDGRVLLGDTGQDLLVRRLRIDGTRAAPEAGGGTSPATPQTVGSRLATVRLGGRDYELFAQPVALSLAFESLSGERLPPPAWWVVGLMRADRFRSESLAIDPTNLLLLVLVLLLAILAWPFLKLWSMGPRDRVQVKDALFALFALVMGSGILTVALVDLHSYLSLRHQQDRQLEALSRTLAARFEREVDDAVRQLAALSDEFLMSGPPAKGDPPKLRPSLDRRGFPVYPWTDMVLWADPKYGRQRVKWTTAAVTTPIISMAPRESFRRVVEGRLWAGRDGVPDYALESIVSRNTGQRLALVAIPVGEAPGGGPAWVGFLTARLLSVIGPVLPPGTGFAILEPGGRVLFHSRPSRNLQESLFEECDGEPLLRAAVAARAEHTFSTRYRGEGVRMVVRPLPVGDLSLAVFRDRDLLRTINFETVAAAFFLFGAYLTLLLLLIGLYCIVAPRTRLHWAWPEPERPGRPLLVLLLEGLTLATLVLAMPLSPRTLLPLAIGLPFLTLGLGMLVLTHGHSEERRERRLSLGLVAFAFAATAVSLVAVGGTPGLGALALFTLFGGLLTLRSPDRLGRWTEPLSRHHRGLYLAAGFGALLVLGMLPAAVFYRLLHFDHMQLLIRYGQGELTTALEQREARIRKSLGEPRSGAGAELLAARLQETRDVDYGSAWFDTLWRVDRPAARATGDAVSYGTLEPLPPGTEGAGFDRSARLDPLLADYLPFYNDISVATRLLVDERSDDGRQVRWRPPRKARGPEVRGRFPRYLDVYRRPVPGDAEGRTPEVRVLSYVPGLTWPRTPLWWLGLLLALSLPLAGLVFLARRIFLLGFEDCAVLPPRELRDWPLTTPLLLLAPPFAEQRRLLPAAADSLAVVDLERGPLTADDLPPPEDGLVVLHLDDGPRDAGESRRLLELLEAVVARPAGKAVLVAVAAPDPARLAEPATHPEATEGEDRAREAEDLGRRWARLLGRFVRLHATDPGDPEAFDATLRAAEEELVARLSPEAARGVEGRALRACLDEVFATLREECRDHAFLQPVGRTVAHLPGLERLGRDAVVERIREAADDLYGEIWRGLEEPERLLAAQVARGDLVNATARSALRRLVARRLLVLGPHPRLFAESFRRFVAEAAPPEEVARWEAATSSIWEQLRLAFGVAIVGVALFLFATQRELFQSTLAFVSAMAAGLPAVFGLLGRLQGNRGGAGAASPDAS